MATPAGPGALTNYTPNMAQIAFVNSEQVTPSDTALFPPSVIHCGGAGTLAYVNTEGETINYGAVAAGEILVALVTGIMATGTTATPITRHF